MGGSGKVEGQVSENSKGFAGASMNPSLGVPPRQSSDSYSVNSPMLTQYLQVSPREEQHGIKLKASAGGPPFIQAAVSTAKFTLITTL